MTKVKITNLNHNANANCKRRINFMVKNMYSLSLYRYIAKIIMKPFVKYSNALKLYLIKLYIAHIYLLDIFLFYAISYSYFWTKTIQKQKQIFIFSL